MTAPLGGVYYFFAKIPMKEGNIDFKLANHTQILQVRSIKLELTIGCRLVHKDSTCAPGGSRGGKKYLSGGLFRKKYLSDGHE